MARPGPQVRATGVGSTKAKVLIVDGEPDVLESTAVLVEALGYRALQVSDPADILATAEREQPGLILQDPKMPGLVAAGLVAALRLNPRTAEVPLVFFGAEGVPGTAAARYDAWGHLAKPFGREDLTRLLRQVLGSAAKLGGPRLASEIQREVRLAFHGYWNLLAALNNYVLVLGESGGLGPEAQKAVDGLDELILKLESKTDRLNTYTMGLVGSLEPVPPPNPTSATREQP